MSESKTIFAVDSFIGKDAIVAIKTKGMSIISKSVEMCNGIFDKADEIVSFGKAINESGMQMYLSLDMKDIFMSILSETGADNRMFVRKAERTIFENVHKLVTKLQQEGAAPTYVELDTDMFSVVESIKFSFEEQTRIINAVINAVKSAAPAVKISLANSSASDNEAAKKWFNRFQVSGGKPFDIVSLKFDMNAETFYDMTLNMSDLSRRFEAEIIIDITGVQSPDDADISVSDVATAVGLVPLDRGFGIICSESLLATGKMVA